MWTIPVYFMQAKAKNVHSKEDANQKSVDVGGKSAKTPFNDNTLLWRNNLGILIAQDIIYMYTS